MNSSGDTQVTYEDAVAKCVDFLAQPGFRVLAIDGRSGSGKTHFADVVSHRATTPHHVLHLDDVYQGWHGLRQGMVIAQGLVADLDSGKPTSYMPYRWPGMEAHEKRTLDAHCPLIIEGVGSTVVASEITLNLTVWFNASQCERKHRALLRDGASYEPFWDMWEKQESALFSALYPKSSLYVESYET